MAHTLVFALVKSQLFRVLGVLAEVFFDKMLDHHSRLLDIYMKSLKQEVSRRQLASRYLEFVSVLEIY